MRHDFYAYMDRMKYIKRWQLMRSTRDENIMEHSQSVALLAHALVTIHNEVYGGNADVLKTVLCAMYHETSEVMTGDLPTPIKYYNKNIHGAYKEIEKNACEKIVKTLPQEMQGSIAPYVLADSDCTEQRLVKAADRLAAKSPTPWQVLTISPCGSPRRKAFLICSRLRSRLSWTLTPAS